MNMPRVNVSLIADFYERDWFGIPGVTLLDHLVQTTSRREGKALFNRFNSLFKSAFPKFPSPKVYCIGVDSTGSISFITLSETKEPST